MESLVAAHTPASLVSPPSLVIPMQLFAVELRMVVQLQGENGVYFAGAWCGYGFHEDGLKAGIDVAQRLGASHPWPPRSASPKISLLDRLCISVFDRFARVALVAGSLTLILPNGQERQYGSRNPEAPEPGESGVILCSADPESAMPLGHCHWRMQERCLPATQNSPG